MLRIRLRRIGKKKQPVYRIVVADSRSPRDGAFVEVLGHYHPLDNPSTVVLDAEKTRHWLDRGAQPSDRVSKILALEGIRELPPKLQARIALGEQRAEEAKKKPQADEATPAAEATAGAPAEPAEAAAPAAEAAPETIPEAPAAEAVPEEAPEAPAEQPAAEATPAEEPAAEEESGA
ncbi:MAG: 30S ribosomal protein S16 [Dehalococcoidia bacterium]